ncbi:MAG: MFS transporter [Undibacterium sp.]|nr:MFS transporter [Opitutaceae bacterium]
MSNETVDYAPIAPNAKRLLWAGFMAILAAGVGAAVRGGIFTNWSREFGFTATQLGLIGGAGFTGFCFGIIIAGLLVDKIGYGKVVLVAFALHILSAIVTFGATTPQNAEQMLTWGMFIFAFANGTLEGVANPLVATLFPKQRTHYLNILHASWPAGLVIGSVAGWILGDRMNLSWKIQLAVYLVPTLGYGLMFLGQKFPKSEASLKGTKFGEMLKDVGIIGAAVICYLLALFFAETLHLGNTVGYVVGGALLLTVGVITKFSMGSFLLFVLFVTHMLLGAVELGTDGWIQNITGNLFTPEQGKFLFIWTSAIMFTLRFCAHWVEKTLKLSPIGLLLICAVIASVGLRLSSGVQTFTMALIALGIYAVGKTFFWPTMLAVASDRFPRTGAVAISIMGGIGMLSAGMLGGPGLGYGKDRFAAEALNASNPAAYAEVKVATPSKFLFFSEVNAIDGKKLADAKDAKVRDPKQAAIVAADQAGDRATLKADSYIPAVMAAIYLCLFIYFKSIGGYKVLTLADEERAEKA